MGEKGEVLPAERGDEELQAAGERDSRIRQRVALIKTEWWRLAEDLYWFHQGREWELQGDPDMTLEAWLAEPDIEIEESAFHQLVRIYREVCVKHEVPVAELAGLGRTKVARVLPAVKRGKVSIEDGLADARTLGRADLRKRYATGDPADDTDEPERVRCSTCGSWVAPGKIS